MSDVERPTILTVLGVLAIIGGVLSIIGGIFFLLAAFGAFKISVVWGLLALVVAALTMGAGVVGLLAGIKIMGNKPKGVSMLKLYTYIGIASSILWQIIATAALKQPFEIGGLVKNLIIPIIILVVLFTQQAVKDYEQKVG
jgi:hypothetical protein